MTNRHLDIGQRGEELAVEYLEAQGWEILARNVSYTIGEIDIVAVRKIRRGLKFAKLIAFVEVKTRSAPDDPRAGARAVTRSKRQKIIRASRVFLRRESIGKAVCRFDVIAVDLDPEVVCTHFANAFDASGGIR